ncbi:MAG: phosphoglycolate phosphatase [Ramlibacter sp.]
MPTRLDLTAAIVDLDGTLVHTLGDFSAALDAVHDELALPRVPAGDVESMVGKGSEHLIRSALRAAGGPQDLYGAAWEAYQRHYDRVNGEYAEVYAGVVPGLRLLRARGLRMACVTNKPTGFAKELLASKQLAPFFDLVFGGDAFARKKPDPEPLRRTCEALGSRPGRTLVIGDSSNDAAAARAAGCPVLLVTYGYNHGEPVRAVDADGFLDSLAEVGDWL